jgi:hypothetical protein
LRLPFGSDSGNRFVSPKLKSEPNTSIHGSHSQKSTDSGRSTWNRCHPDFYRFHRLFTRVPLVKRARIRFYFFRLPVSSPRGHLPHRCSDPKTRTVSKTRRGRLLPRRFGGSGRHLPRRLGGSGRLLPRRPGGGLGATPSPASDSDGGQISRCSLLSTR